MPKYETQQMPRGTPEQERSIKCAQAHQMAALFIRRARKSASLSSKELASRLNVALEKLNEAQSFRSLAPVDFVFLLEVAEVCECDLSLTYPE